MTRRQTPPEAATPPVGGRYEPLSPSELGEVVDHAFAMVAEIGMADAPAAVAQHLTQAGATLRDDGRMVLPRSMVEAALERAPSSVDLPGLDPERGIQVGGGRVHIGTGGAAVQTLDASTGEYRDSTVADLYDMMRVLEASANVHYGLRPLVARDVEDDTALDLETALACVAGTGKPIGVSFTRGETVDPVVDLLDMALGETPFAKQPYCMAVIVHVVPPLRWSPEGCDAMLAAIDRDMIIQTCSAGQAGATSPAALAGALAQGLAEILAAVTLIDAVRPGHPAIHAFMPFISDLRTGAMSGGSGEAAVASAAAAQLMGHLGIPGAVSAGITDAKVADAQAGYEKGYTVALAAHAGADMVQLSVGMLGSIMVASPESLVIDDEMCGAILRSVRGIDTSGLDLSVVESVVTGDGHYLGEPQTLNLMRSEYVYPTLGDRRSVAEWQADGSPTVWDSAQARVAEILASEPTHIDPGRIQAIRERFGLSQ